MDKSITSEFITSTDMLSSYATNVSLRGMDKNRTRFWQLFNNGLVHFRRALSNRIQYSVLENYLSNLITFAANYYQKEFFPNGNIQLNLTLLNSMDTVLLLPAPNESQAVCRIEKIFITKELPENLSCDDIQPIVKNLMDEFSVRFNAPIISKNM